MDNKKQQRGRKAKASSNTKKSTPPAVRQTVSALTQSIAAAAYATGQHQRGPMFLDRKSDSVRIRHKELVASVNGTVSFDVPVSLSLNPGLATTFPWLSTQAQGWERYRFHRLVFRYLTRTATSSAGSVMLVPDYDPADSEPTSEQIASAYEDAVEDAPWKDMSCDLRASAMHPLGPSKFVRTGPLSPNQDIKTYDVGNMFVCTVDGTASPWGKLWAEYEVEFFTPQLSPVGGGSVLTAERGENTETPTDANPFGTIASLGTWKSGDTPVYTITGKVLTFLKSGSYFVKARFVSSVSTTLAAPTLGVGATFVGEGYQNSGSGGGSQGATTTIQLQAPAGGTITFNITISGGTGASLLVAKLPSDMA